MKKRYLHYLFIILFSLSGLVSCKKDKNETDSVNSDSNNNGNGGDNEVEKGNLTLHLHTFIGETEVDGLGIEMQTLEGRIISLTKAQMYISGIQLVKLDGSLVDVPYNLLKLFEAESVVVGDVPVGNYKSIKFKVGLNAATNTLIPSLSSDSIILNKPAMWFGSSAQPDGYVFMNCQGTIDTSSAMNETPVPFIYKIGTNSNYVQVSMPEQNFTVFKNNVNYLHMVIDYSKLFNGIQINMTNNLQVNSTSDNALPIAIAIKNNIPLMFRYE